MKNRLIILCIALTVLMAAAGRAAEDNEAATVLTRYFDTLGGLDNLLAVHSISVTVRMDSFNYEYRLTLQADGRFRQTEKNRITGFDGSGYWQENFGLVTRPAGDPERRYGDIALRTIFFQGLIDKAGHIRPLEFIRRESGQETQWDILGDVDDNGFGTLYFFNRSTGLLEKMVNIIARPDGGAEKIMTLYSDYLPAGNIRLFTRREVTNLTDDGRISPPIRYIDPIINHVSDPAIYQRPISRATPATLRDSAIHGRILGISDRGDLVLNVTRNTLEKLGIAVNDVISAEIEGDTLTFRYLDSISDAGSVVAGDRFAMFNDTPLLWLIRIHDGMGGGFKANEPVLIRKGRKTAESGAASPA